MNFLENENGFLCALFTESSDEEKASGDEGLPDEDDDADVSDENLTVLDHFAGRLRGLKIKPLKKY